MTSAETPACPDPGRIFSVNERSFDRLAEEVLSWQRACNPVYAAYSPSGVYLPIEAFRLSEVVCDAPGVEFKPEAVFRSSGTGTGRRARHSVLDLSIYDRSIEFGFRRAFGAGPFRLLIHLPEYAAESSLVYMGKRLIERFGAPGSAMFVDDSTPLGEAAGTAGAPVILFGAAFGLLDLLERRPVALPAGSRVIETGGMKTHRRQMGRADLHQRLATGFGVPRESVFSEYGMCEMLSQCYTRGGEDFTAPPWVRISIVDPESPDRELPEGQPGAIAIIDLANLHSAAAILTADRGVRMKSGFQVLGRLTGTELRGCNFLLEEA